MRPQKHVSQWIAGCLLLVLFVSACAATPTPADTIVPANTPDQTEYTDPFAYCAAVDTIDTPDARYTGPAAPDAIIESLREKAGISEDAPADWVTAGTVWRCMDSSVWGCFVGANLPCSEKADTSTDPSAEMQSFCEENPDAEVIPAAVTGRATVYSWSCKGSTATAGEQLVTPDSQGYLADFWYELNQ